MASDPAAQRRTRRGSLRRRTYGVVLAVVAAPLVVIFASQLLDADEARRMAAAAARGAEAAEALALRGDDAEDMGGALDAAARRERVRLRVLDARGGVIEDRDHEPATSLRDRIGDLFFGPDGAPTLGDYEREAPPLSDRPIVRRALADDRAEACARALGGKLLVCEAARRAGPRVVLAQKSSPRAIRALYDVRWPLLKLTLYVLFAGVALAAWLGRRIVRPVEALRAEIMDRAAAPVPGDALARPQAPGEIDDLANAFNALLAAIAAHRRKSHEFMADLAHELKSPVAAVRAAAEAMEDPGALTPARAERLRRVLAESGRRLDALVTQFLELSRAEAGLPSEERAPVCAGEMVTRLVDAMRADERNAGIQFDVSVAPVRVEAVTGRLEAAIRNLLDNAASFAGGDGAFDDGAPGAVRARVRAEGDACVIEVADTGPGLSPEVLPRVFDRFFTARAGPVATAGAGPKGTGLGLALAKAIVEAHGGTLTAASPPEGGALFTVRLPRSGSHGVHLDAADVSPRA